MINSLQDHRVSERGSSAPFQEVCPSISMSQIMTNAQITTFTSPVIIHLSKALLSQIPVMNLYSHSSEQPEMYCFYLKIKLSPEGSWMDMKAKFIFGMVAGNKTLPSPTWTMHHNCTVCSYLNRFKLFWLVEVSVLQHL